jgi:hypothetical protein
MMPVSPVAPNRQPARENTHISFLESRAARTSCSLAKSLLSLLGWLSTPSMVVLTGNLAVDLSLTGTSHWHSSAKNSILATRNKDIFCGCQDQQLPIKSTELISINRPYRQSRSEATNTHTHKGPTSSRKTTEVLPPRHEVLLISTRKNPRPNTLEHNQSKPQTPD